MPKPVDCETAAVGNIAGLTNAAVEPQQQCHPECFASLGGEMWCVYDDKLCPNGGVDAARGACFVTEMSNPPSPSGMSHCATDMKLDTHLLRSMPNLYLSQEGYTTPNSYHFSSTSPTIPTRSFSF